MSELRVQGFTDRGWGRRPKIRGGVVEWYVERVVCFPNKRSVRVKGLRDGTESHHGGRPS